MKNSLSSRPNNQRCFSAIDLRNEQVYQLHIKFIIQARLLCKLSQQSAADLANIDRVTLNRYENQSQTMSLPSFVRIRTAYEGYICDQRLKLSPEMADIIRRCNVATIKTDDGYFLYIPL